MVSSKLPELGMPKWIAFLLPLDSIDAILILMSIPGNITTHSFNIIITYSDNKYMQEFIT
jgi:hypothetical protein